MRSKLKRTTNFYKLLDEYILAEGNYLLLQNQFMQEHNLENITEERERRCLDILHDAIKSHEQEPVKKKTRKNHHWIAAAAIIAVCLITLSAAAYAVSKQVWFAGWNDDYFAFYQEDQSETTEYIISEPDEPFETLEEALAYYNAPENLIPTYIPDGYEFYEFDYAVYPDVFAFFTVYYSDGTSYIHLDYTLNSNLPGTQHFKDEGEPEIYTANGIDHYIMTNSGKYLAVWQNGFFDCSLIGFESQEELIKTIDSLYTEAIIK